MNSGNSLLNKIESAAQKKAPWEFFPRFLKVLKDLAAPKVFKTISAPPRLWPNSQRSIIFRSPIRTVGLTALP